MTDPNEPGAVPEPVRAEALSAAMAALETFLEGRGIVLAR